jgi:hypothetical protein
LPNLDVPETDAITPSSLQLGDGSPLRHNVHCWMNFFIFVFWNLNTLPRLNLAAMFAEAYNMLKTTNEKCIFWKEYVSVFE